MQSSMVLFVLAVFDGKYPFLENLFQKLELFVEA